MNRTNFLIVLFLIMTTISCKDYYNDTIEWMDNLESGMSIESVRKVEPNFVEIDWDNPHVFENEKWYSVKIKGNRDVLKMSHYLVFIEDKYQYRESKK